MQPASLDFSMEEMYDFFAFEDALENQLSPASLIEEQSFMNRVELNNRVMEWTSHLHECVDEKVRQGKELLADAKKLAPKDAQEYYEGLREGILVLKQEEIKQKQEFDLAQKTISEQKGQIALLMDSIKKMQSVMKSQKHAQSYNETQLNELGKGLCNYLAGAIHK